WLTEFFRLMPGTHRSDHYSHSVAAKGKGAAGFIADHLSNEGYGSPWDKAPWGKTYGTHSPMVRAYEQGGKLLMLGVDYETSTYIHLVEVMYWNELLKMEPEALYPRLDRPKLGAFWDQTGDVRRGSVGQADCRCFKIRVYVDTLLEEVRRDSEAYGRNRS
ncbi:MAG: AAC(3) family N-acetyltransferase, partial [bacterium]|nr:AAC(3) family N-acetyltransferase [bacterium]